MDTTLTKGLRLIETLARSGEPRGITQLAGELRIAKSNVHRLLQTLAHNGYVTQDPASSLYSSTLKLWELGTLLTERLDVRATASPYMRDLARRTSETVHLSVLEGREVLYIDKIDSPQPVRAYSRVGGRAPAHCVATGKAMLAHVSGAALSDVLKHLARHTSRTITDPKELRKELDLARTRGYAVNRGEWREGVCGVAAAIFDRNGEVVAAIGLSGPADRLTAKYTRNSAPLVFDAANAISSALGHGRAGARQAAL